MKKYQIIDSSSSDNKIDVDTRDQLFEILITQARKGNNIVLFEAPSGKSLTLGTGNSYGFVEFMDNNGKIPYLLAVNNTEIKDVESFIEFNSGGTPTPIPIYACLPFDQVIKIALYFFDNDDIPKDITWQEV